MLIPGSAFSRGTRILDLYVIHVSFHLTFVLFYFAFQEWMNVQLHHVEGGENAKMASEISHAHATRDMLARTVSKVSHCILILLISFL